ncbi:hypothetical protein [Peribacillus sp. NPDC060253]|uniref:hypothetical protein n=1 Tax=Peribacillus sp. NPDC060253 TaxID=3347084 RepID=UPI0036537FF1
MEAEKILKRIVHIEDSDSALDQSKLIGGSPIDSVVFSNIFSDRTKKASKMLYSQFNMETTLAIPYTDQHSNLMKDYVSLLTELKIGKIILKIGTWGINNSFMDPGGFQYQNKKSIQDLQSWISDFKKNHDIPIYLHPIRQLSLSPQLFYKKIITELSDLHIPLSIDLGCVLSDYKNWGTENKKEILGILKGNPLISMFWLSAVRKAGDAYIPCACERVDDEIWDMLGLLTCEDSALILMTDRLSNDSQITADIKKLMNVKGAVPKHEYFN